MAISLRDINADNYEAVCDLDVAESQQDYVACNMWSLVESHYNSGYTCKAIYCNEDPVGFSCGYRKARIKCPYGAL
ncbi:hypothetical protein GCM10011338_22760 [Alteromonas lipolytica]|nr:hypothetical protein GCM10011338_22760 [Alteromonas lipolytica]